MKKVLASVLAGSMVLGMASMASAAELVKAEKKGDYDFRMVNVYDGKDGESYTRYEKWEEVVGKVPADVVTALNAYKKAYDKIADKTSTIKYAELKAVYDTYSDLVDEVDGVAALKADKAFKDIKTEFQAVGNMAAFVAKVEAANNGKITIGDSNAASIAGTAKFGAALAPNLPIRTPSDIIDDLVDIYGIYTGTGSYGDINKAEFELKDGTEWYNLYNFGEDDTKEITVQVPVKKDDSLRVDVASGKVTVTRKKYKTDRNAGIDYYNLTIKAAAGVRDFETDDFKIEVELKDANIVFFIKGKVAYSDWQYVEPGEVLRADKKSKYTALHDRGCVFNFDEVIDDETRIICNDYVDLLFKGNYGTDYENLRVMTDDIKEVEDFFQDYDIDYYDFIGLPKFAKDITVRVDADSDSYIYEFDKKTGDVVDITDECEYTSDGWTFKRKSLKTYVVLEEPYEGGNVRADKEPVDDEPTEPDDTDATGSKPNPGTGAMPF